LESIQQFWYEIAALFDHPRCLLPIHYVNHYEDLPIALIVVACNTQSNTNEPLIKVDPMTGMISWNDCAHSSSIREFSVSWFQQFLSEAKQKPIRAFSPGDTVGQCLDELCNRLDDAILTKTRTGRQYVRFAHSAMHLGKFLYCKARPSAIMSDSSSRIGGILADVSGRSLNLIYRYNRTQKVLAFNPLGSRSAMTCRVEHSMRKYNTTQQQHSANCLIAKSERKRMEESSPVKLCDNLSTYNNTINQNENLSGKQVVRKECVKSCLSDDSHDEESDAFVESRLTLRRIKRKDQIESSDSDNDSSDDDSDLSDGSNSNLEKQRSCAIVHGVSKRARRDDIEWAWSEARNDYALDGNDEDHDAAIHSNDEV